LDGAEYVRVALRFVIDVSDRCELVPGNGLNTPGPRAKAVAVTKGKAADTHCRLAVHSWQLG